MEIVSGPACSSCDWIDHFSEWKQGIKRSSSAKARGFEMKLSIDSIQILFRGTQVFDNYCCIRQEAGIVADVFDYTL